MSSDSSAVFMLAFHRYSFILDGFDTLSLCGRVSVSFCTVSLCSGKPAGIESEGGFCYNAYLFMRMPQVRNLQKDLSLSVSAFWNCSCIKA